MDERENITGPEDVIKSGGEESQAAEQEPASPEEAETAAEEAPIAYELIKGEDQPESVKKFEFKIPTEAFKEKLENKLKDVRSSVVIPGFRKGKAPMKLVEIQFGEAARRESVEDVFPGIMKDFLKDKNLDVFGNPRLTKFEVADDYSVSLEAEIEYIPSLDLPEDAYKNVDVTIPHIDVTDEMVDKYLENIRWQSAMLEPKAENAIFEPTDALVADLLVIDENGQEISYLSGENKLYKRPEQELPGEVVTALKGKKRNEKVSVTVPVERKNKEGTIISHHDTFDVIIIDLKAVKLPELNDEFARDLGDFESLEDLRTKIKKDMENEAKEEERHHIIEKVFAEIIKNHPLTLPKGMIQNQTHQLALSDLRQLHQQGLSLPESMHEKFIASKEQTAITQLMAWLIRREIMRKENITVSEEDIQKELERMGEQMGRKALAIRASLERQQKFDDFVEELKMRNVDNIIINSAKIHFEEMK